MKIKDLPPSTNLGGVKVKTPSGQTGYWASQWVKGVWLTDNPQGGGKVTPVFLDNLTDALEWEVIAFQDGSIPAGVTNPPKNFK